MIALDFKFFVVFALICSQAKNIIFVIDSNYKSFIGDGRRGSSDLVAPSNVLLFQRNVLLSNATAFFDLVSALGELPCDLWS